MIVERTLRFKIQPRAFESIEVGGRVVYDTQVDGDAGIDEINGVIQHALDTVVQADLEEAARVVADDVTSFASYWRYDEEG